MSCTELYCVDAIGNVIEFDNVHNSHRGAMAVWMEMEEKYLPPYKPSWATGEYAIGKTFYRCHGIGNDDEMKKIWKITSDKSVPILDKIVMLSTYDKVMVRTKNIKILIDAFNQFSGETSLKEQAEKIEALLKEDDKVQGIAWNQTSVCCGVWDYYDDESEESHPYNISIHEKKHWWLFEELEDYEKDELKSLGYEL